MQQLKTKSIILFLTEPKTGPNQYVALPMRNVSGSEKVWQPYSDLTCSTHEEIFIKWFKKFGGNLSSDQLSFLRWKTYLVI